MFTQWGYEIESDTLPSILTPTEFNEMTLNKFSQDSRVQTTINSVVASMRNYCGWHLGGNVKCSVTYSFDDLHITRLGNGILLIQLPSRCATEVTKILINNSEVTPYYFLKVNGILKIYDNCGFFKTITIEFMSGLDDDGLKGLVVSRVSNVLNGVFGISRETAGGVSISYNNDYSASSNSTTLLTADKEFLDTYKITELL